MVHTLWNIILIWNLLEKVSSALDNVSTREYCSSEVFASRCSPGKLVVMGEAFYGRMHIGKCVKRDVMGSLGCGGNVLKIADQKCSGLSNCEIRVPNGDMNKAALGCDAELSRYLEVSHTCVKAVNVQQKQCNGAVTIPVTSEAIHIPSTISQNTSCGLHKAPWILEAAPGQTIGLSLLDFSWTRKEASAMGDRPYSNTQLCQQAQYGYIIDLNKDDEMIKICGGMHRESHLYTSKSHRVQIVLSEKEVKNRRFLIQHIAVGCPDLVKPKHAWTKRKKDELIVGCMATRQTWHLKCHGNRWVGVIGNCTQYLDTEPGKSAPNERNPIMQTSIAILVIIGVASAISCSIIIVGILCYKRLSRQNKKLEAEYQCSTLNRNQKDLYNIKSDMNDVKSYGYPDQIYPFGKNEYTHIWDQQSSHGQSDSRDEIQVTVPLHEAPLLPKPRLPNANNNTVVSGSEPGVFAHCLSEGGGGNREETVYRPCTTTTDPSGNGGPTASKYFILDRAT